jgi:tripartite-type tricarboxylate transporter receptor subunit TctC
MFDVKASSKDVRKLASSLKRYQEEMKQASQSVQKAIGAANWHDRQKDQFVARFQGHNKQVNRFVNDQVNEMIKSLSVLASKLEDIERMKM